MMVVMTTTVMMMMMMMMMMMIVIKSLLLTDACHLPSAASKAAAESSSNTGYIGVHRREYKSGSISMAAQVAASYGLRVYQCAEGQDPAERAQEVAVLVDLAKRVTQTPLTFCYPDHAQLTQRER
jgi:hypothetical protein